MARQRMFTRTVKGTRVTAKVVNLDDSTVAEATLTLGTTYKSEKEMLEAAKEAYETDTLKVVQVYNPEIFAERYAMPESFFIANAIKIDTNTDETDSVEE